jgi:hypothetical protein
MKYNILVKIRMNGEVCLIMNRFEDMGKFYGKIWLIQELNELGEFNDSIYGRGSLKELIKLEGRNLEELREDKRKREVDNEFHFKEDDGIYKVISGEMEEIIGEIREILLLQEII